MKYGHLFLNRPLQCQLQRCNARKRQSKVSLHLLPSLNFSSRHPNLLPLPYLGSHLKTSLSKAMTLKLPATRLVRESLPWRTFTYSGASNQDAPLQTLLAWLESPNVVVMNLTPRILALYLYHLDHLPAHCTIGSRTPSFRSVLGTLAMPSSLPILEPCNQLSA